VSLPLFPRNFVEQTNVDERGFEECLALSVGPHRPRRTCRTVCVNKKGDLLDQHFGSPV
jgi:hypothetical protein